MFVSSFSLGVSAMPPELHLQACIRDVPAVCLLHDTSSCCTVMPHACAVLRKPGRCANVKRCHRICKPGLRV